MRWLGLAAGLAVFVVPMKGELLRHAVPNFKGADAERQVRPTKSAALNRVNPEALSSLSSFIPKATSPDLQRLNFNARILEQSNGSFIDPQRGVP